jgi:nucleoid-associated protein YgaU
MFGQRILALAAVVAAFAGLALSRPGETSGSGAERRHVVRPGDTLWAIAEARYPGDPREAVWRIEERNGLETPMILPGSVLILPP